MKALVKFQPGPGHVELRDVPEPVPAADQVKLGLVEILTAPLAMPGAVTGAGG